MNMKPTKMKEPRIEMLHLPKIFAIATIGTRREYRNENEVVVVEDARRSEQYEVDDLGRGSSVWIAVVLAVLESGRLHGRTPSGSREILATTSFQAKDGGFEPQFHEISASCGGTERRFSRMSFFTRTSPLGPWL
jgi:hypothetical protein